MNNIFLYIFIFGYEEEIILCDKCKIFISNRDNDINAFKFNIDSTNTYLRYIGETISDITSLNDSFSTSMDLEDPKEKILFESHLYKNLNSNLDNFLNVLKYFLKLIYEEKNVEKEKLEKSYSTYYEYAFILVHKLKKNIKCK